MWYDSEMTDEEKRDKVLKAMLNTKPKTQDELKVGEECDKVSQSD